MTNRCSKCPGVCLLMGLSMAWVGVAWAQSSMPGTTIAPVTGWRAISDSRLDAVRGGFDVGSGLLVSFGIERAVYINGNLASSVSVNIPDVGRMTAEQASALAATTSTVNIRNGPGNTFDPAALNHAAAATVIQNSLDNQDIQSLTTINAAVNNLGTFDSLNLQRSLQAGLINSLGH
ncbi:hypothetical protein ACPPVV_07890 [Rhodanobacter sp. Col0626]|uniref:hypothetical protein n=1 Tax=Rhodanobacter sp. Col0626 TaxID=3415679 RepID=UPI003CE83CD1